MYKYHTNTANTFFITNYEISKASLLISFHSMIFFLWLQDVFFNLTILSIMKKCNIHKAGGPIAQF